MARKTKQEKIIADLRRKLEASKRGKWEIRTDKLEAKLEDEKAKTKESHRSLQYPVSSFTIPTSYIKKGLLRTLILTLVAISLEVVVYLVWR